MVWFEASIASRNEITPIRAGMAMRLSITAGVTIADIRIVGDDDLNSRLIGYEMKSVVIILG